MQSIIEQRINDFRHFLQQEQIDAFLVLIEENRFYLSGFDGEDQQFDESAGALLITSDTLVLATDSRYETQARQQAPLYEVKVYRQGLARELPLLIERLGAKNLGFESVRVSVETLQAFRKELRKTGKKVTLKPIKDAVESLRLIKTPDEVKKTMDAVKMAEEAFLKVVETIRVGMTEKQLAWSLEKEMHDAGADRVSFPIIVASGPNSALPHASPTDRPIREGEPVLFDWGARLNGYCSDISRTLLIGKPDDMFLKVYNTVLEAQRKAVKAVKQGAGSITVDAAARDHIHQQGFQGKFGHSLGHGTGLAIHEAPRIGPLKKIRLESGMLFTVEPGVYLPGWGGVRIENQVVVTPDGHYVLNNLNTSYAVHSLRQ